MEIRECIVKIYDADGVEHSVKIRAESVYEAGLKGFERFDRLNLAKDDGCVIVEVHETPTIQMERAVYFSGSLSIVRQPQGTRVVSRPLQPNSSALTPEGSD